MIRENLGYRLKEIMDQKEFSFTALSKKSGISRDHLYNIVNGTKEVGVDTIEKITTALGILPKTLFDFKNIDCETKIDHEILNDFSSLPNNFWDFSDSKTDDLIHNLHNYPAVMIYPISRAIFGIVSKYKRIDTVMDPFVGSGTVIVEAQLKGFKHVIGNDLNPLALLITKAKTTLLSEKSFEDINRLIGVIKELEKLYIPQIKEFERYVLSNYKITEKGEWSLKADEITNQYFSNTSLNEFKAPKFDNLGFWFRPESIIELSILKQVIDKIATENDKAFLYCSLSETIRSCSNTRTSEFKLYRKPINKILSKENNALEKFVDVLNKNLEKEYEYSKVVRKNSEIKIINDNAQNLFEVKDGSVDLVLTSPPYGDSHTTVAYGQFSRLSNFWLELSEDKNLDSKLLGGKKSKNQTIESLGSKTLIEKIKEISKLDNHRALEVLDFYFDLDKSLEEITKKCKKSGYQFWVVGNRTVKKVNIPTDVILEELGEKYNLKVLAKFYRRISNKVMPSVNSPSNKAGDVVQTMCNEIIVFFKKIK